MKIRKVTLELLRHGPPHNQLLSPLTEYLGLCGNHQSVTVRVPYEHNQFLARHESLNYGELSHGESEQERQRRETELKLTAGEMSAILAGVPGLIAELSDKDKKVELTHFEIVMSASELALLPFELADAPDGFPGTGTTLTLQNDSPLCLTRRVRRVDNDRFEWPKKVKILFAASSPPGLPPVPFKAHLAALRQVLGPWIRRAGDSVTPREALIEHLTVLPKASARLIRKELSTGEYTHLHILAHGVKYKEGYDERFGLALHDDRDPTRADHVSSKRLATSVHPFEDRDYRLGKPAVVTLASCHGAGQGSVVGAGASVAHTLHESGIPLVVSSQFPLSFAGSVMMVEHLYQGLLWGTDPRPLLNDLRRRLESEVPQTHDWASLVTYAAFPIDFERQLAELCFAQAKRAIETAFYYVDWNREVWFNPDASLSGRPDEQPPELYVEFLERLARAKDKLGQLVRQDQRHLQEHGYPCLRPEVGGWVRGLLASTAKREAEVQLRDPRSEEGLWMETLSNAQQRYAEAFEADRTQVWALAQEVTLALVLAIRRGKDEKTWKEKLRRRWWAAYGLFHRQLESRDQQQSVWAHSNLIELYMVWLFVCRESDHPKRRSFRREYARAKERIAEHTSALLTMVEDDDKEIRSRRRQSERFVSFFLEPFLKKRPGVLEPGQLEEGVSYPIPELVAGLAWDVAENKLPKSQS